MGTARYIYVYIYIHFRDRRLSSSLSSPIVPSSVFCLGEGWVRVFLLLAIFVDYLPTRRLDEVG